MPLIPYPDVPDENGVPNLPRLSSAGASAASGLSLLEGIVWNVLQQDDQWGVYDSNGNALGDPSLFSGIASTILSSLGASSTLSTNSVEYSKEMRVSDYPVEGGSFASFNKVETPANPRVVLCLSGSQDDRTSFINAIDAATKSTNAYSVVTPEVTYINYTIESYRYDRTAAHGATMYILEMKLKEIRTVSAAYTTASSPINNPQSTDAVPAVDSGTVQPSTPDTSVVSSMEAAYPNLPSSTIPTVSLANMN
jgi:hypothetical protein